MSRTRKDRLNEKHSGRHAMRYFKRTMNSRRRMVLREAIAKGNFDAAAFDLPWDEWSSPRDGRTNNPRWYLVYRDGEKMGVFEGTIKGIKDRVRRMYKEVPATYAIRPVQTLFGLGYTYTYSGGNFVFQRDRPGRLWIIDPETNKAIPFTPKKD